MKIKKVSSHRIDIRRELPIAGDVVVTVSLCCQADKGNKMLLRYCSCRPASKQSELVKEEPGIIWKGLACPQRTNKKRSMIFLCHSGWKQKTFLKIDHLELRMILLVIHLDRPVYANQE